MAEDSGECLGCVGEQVAQHLDDAPPVRHDQRQVGLKVDVDVVTAASAQERVLGLVDQEDRVRRRRSHRQLPGVDAGHVQQVGDQAAHLVGLLLNNPEEKVHFGRVQGGTRPESGWLRNP